MKLQIPAGSLSLEFLSYSVFFKLIFDPPEILSHMNTYSVKELCVLLGYIKKDDKMRKLIWHLLLPAFRLHVKLSLPLYPVTVLET